MICVTCGEDKSRDLFNRDVKKNGNCRDCRADQDRLRKYSLSKVGYNRLVEKQGGLCRICKTPASPLNVDHDHSCCPGETSCGLCIRGLLCERCNKGIGMFEDKKEILKSAIKYLEETNVRSSSSTGSRSRSGARYFFTKKRRVFKQG